MTQNFWTLALLLGLVKTKLDFHTGTEMRHKEPGGNLLFLPPINLTTTPYLLMHGLVPRNAFLVTPRMDPIPTGNEMNTAAAEGIRS